MEDRDPLIASNLPTAARGHRHSYETFPQESADSDEDSKPLLRDDERLRYWAYYLPFLNWIPQYQLKWFRGDCIAALTVASLYIPMCFSFAILAQVNPGAGLYAFIIHPLAYALLGSSPQMVVGPEATGSLLVGAIVHRLHSISGGSEAPANVQIASVATATAGAMLLASGLGRIGFVDSVLNPPFMQGFIGGVGFVLVIEQALPELGLFELAKETGVAHSSAASKLVFILTHISKVHLLTAVVSISSLGFILLSRAVQDFLKSRYPSIQLFPDRLVVVATAAILAWALRLDQKGLDILGSLGSSGSTWPTFHFPFLDFRLVEDVFSTSFLIALLGFFESSVTAKSLRPDSDGLKNSSLSANRELIALGAANIIGGCFSTLPSFGGFGRSKLNVQTGGMTPMSSILLSFISLVSVLFILPYLYYVPKPTLSAMASAVGISMMEEVPHNVQFFIRVRGWRELTLMAAVFLSTVFYSMSVGVAVGGVLTVFQLLQHTTRSRVQILGRVPGTTDLFEDAESVPHNDQFERCLIVRIPEPVTFANAGDLRTRLRRLEFYGTHDAHPSLPRRRDHDRVLILEAQGLTAIDACGTQVLVQVVQEKMRAGTQVIICRIRPSQVWDQFHRSGLVEICGGMEYFVNSVEEALRKVETLE